MRNKQIIFIRNGNKGGIHFFNSNNTVQAFTATQSKTFKTLARAIKWLNKQGYKKAVCQS